MHSLIRIHTSMTTANVSSTPSIYKAHQHQHQQIPPTSETYKTTLYSPESKHSLPITLFTHHTVQQHKTPQTREHTHGDYIHSPDTQPLPSEYIVTIIHLILIETLLLSYHHSITANLSQWKTNIPSPSIHTLSLSLSLTRKHTHTHARARSQINTDRQREVVSARDRYIDRSRGGGGETDSYEGTMHV